MALAISFDQEAAEVRDHLVDLIRFFSPPGGDFGIKGIRRLQTSQFDRRGKAIKLVVVEDGERVLRIDEERPVAMGCEPQSRRQPIGQDDGRKEAGR